MAFHGEIHGDTRQLSIYRALPILSRDAGSLLTHIVDVSRKRFARNGKGRKSSPKLRLESVDAHAIQQSAGVETNAQVSLDGPFRKGFGQTLLSDVWPLRFSVADGMDIRCRASHVDHEHLAPTLLSLHAFRPQNRALKNRHGCR